MRWQRQTETQQFRQKNDSYSYGRCRRYSIKDTGELCRCEYNTNRELQKATETPAPTEAAEATETPTPTITEEADESENTEKDSKEPEAENSDTKDSREASGQNVKVTASRWYQNPFTWIVSDCSTCSDWIAGLS